MKKILVSGSLALDLLYTYADVFQHELFASSKGSLSVAFTVKDKSVHFGGCAGNIVFNGKLLKEDFIMLGIGGHDFGEYEKWLNKNNIDTGNVLREMSEFTAQASVVTDTKGQQITFFHEGAAGRSAAHRHEIIKIINDLKDELVLCHVAPNNRNFMLATIEACRYNKIPFIFDPGQAMPAFSPGELLHLTNTAFGLILNEYELALFEQHTKLTKDDVLRLCPLIIVTRGERGSTIYFDKHEINIPAVISKNPIDPTGCGDAYRAGFLAEIKQCFPSLTPDILKKAGTRGARLATACLEAVGTQNHKI